MEPRLKFSSKWTSFPKELLEQIEQVFYDTFSDKLVRQKFVVEGRIYLREVLFRVGLKQPKELSQFNIETSLEYDKDKDNMLKSIHFSVDCAATLLDQYLDKSSEEPLPKIWTPLKIEGKEIYFQTSAVNSELENQANALLGEEEGTLFEGEDLDSELDEKISMLGLSNEDFDQDSEVKKSKKKLH